MANYNDGKWHGWNGGDCPVHPRSEVEAVCESTCHSGYGRVTWKVAGDMTWGETPQPIIAFRVVKEYREPRDFWLVHVPGYVTKFTLHHYEAAALLKQREEGGRILHVREVL